MLKKADKSGLKGKEPNLLADLETALQKSRIIERKKVSDLAKYLCSRCFCEQCDEEEASTGHSDDQDEEDAFGSTDEKEEDY